MGHAMVTAVGLEQLNAGDEGEIFALKGPDHELSRLASLGIRGGARIRILRSGRTCIVEVDESRVCVRPGPDTRILVRSAR